MLKGMALTFILSLASPAFADGNGQGAGQANGQGGGNGNTSNSSNRTLPLASSAAPLVLGLATVLAWRKLRKDP